MGATITLLGIVIGIEIAIGLVVIRYGRWHPATGTAPTRASQPGTAMILAMTAFVFVAIVILVWLWLIVAQRQ